MNDVTYKKEPLIEFYKNTPEDIRDILIDDNFGPAIQIIGRKNGVNPTQSLDIEDIVVHVLLGVEPEEGLIARIQKKINVPKETARGITEDLEKNIFSYVKEPLKKIQRNKKFKLNGAMQKPPLSALIEKTGQKKVTAQKTPDLKNTAPATHPLKMVISKPPIPIPAENAQDANIAQQTPPTPPEPTVGAVKADEVNIKDTRTLTPRERASQELQKGEHMFEKKLRETYSQPVTKPQKEVPAPPTPPEKKIDPYREMPEN